MFILDLLVVLVIALVITAILSAVAGWRHPAYRDMGTLPGAVFLFLILVFFIWAGGIWLVPFGPTLWGVSWLPFLIVGLIVALLIAALSPPAPPPRTPAEAVEEAEREREQEAVAATAFGVVFWVLLIGLIGAVVVNYAAGV
jgi:hypothetical protein